MRLAASLAAAAAVLSATEVSAGETGEDRAFSLRVGAAVATAPLYEGSKEHRVLGLPLFAPGGSGGNGTWGRVRVRDLDDFRLRLLQLGGFELGPSAGYRIGREEDDARRLHGLGDVDGGLTLGAYGAFRTGSVMASLGYSHQVTGDDAGALLRFDVESRQRVSERVTLRAGIGTTWADEEHMQSRFGVTSAQAARSAARLSRFDAQAGVKDVNTMIGAAIELDPRWTLMLTARYAHLVGDAAESPIVETEHQLSGSVGLTYRFELGGW